MSEIAEAIREITRSNEEIYHTVGVVKSVNKSKRTCVVEPSNGDAEIFNVRLQSFIGNSKGIVIYPKKGTDVIVGWLSKEVAFVAACGEFEKISVVNDQVDVKQVLDDWASVTEDLIQTLQQVQISTPAGPGAWDPNTLSSLIQHKVAIGQVKQMINQVIE